MSTSNPNTRFFALSITSASLTVLLVFISLATPHWESHVFDEECVISKNTTDAVVLRKDDYFTLVLSSNYTAVDSRRAGQPPVIVDEDGVVEEKVYPIINKYAGVWTLCNLLSDASQESIYGGQKKKCFDYIREYPSVKSSLSRKAIYYIQMRNAAISSLILDLLMLFAATVTAVVGLVTNQVLCLMVTGVMFVLTAFYTSMALIVMHVKMGKEVKTCTGIEEIPSLMCDCFQIHADWSLYAAWVAVFMCLVSFAMWIHLARLLSQTASKLSL